MLNARWQLTSSMMLTNMNTKLVMIYTGLRIALKHDVTLFWVFWKCSYLCSVNCSRSHGRRADNQCISKRRRIVRADTCLANESVSRHNSRDVAVLSIKAMRIKWLYSKLSVIVSHWGQASVLCAHPVSLSFIFCSQSEDLDWCEQ